MTVRKLHFHVNEDKPDAKALKEVLAARLAKHGIMECSGRDADVIAALGGDGTILRAVHEYPGVPVLGLNLGGLGYLSNVEKKDFEPAIEALAEGRFRISARSMLSVRRLDASGPAFSALNDVVLVREMSGHAALLDLAVDGRAATRYMADGLVVATPTGSTAYSLAAGGPVLMPDSGSFVVTPMNPHALGIRPMVVSDAVSMAVTPRRRANGTAEKIGVYADGGNVFMLGGDETIVISKAAQGADMVVLDGYDPYEVLARKLGWSGSSLR